MKDKLLQIISYYGILKQLKYIHSEYFELDEAILNELNDEYTYFEKIHDDHKAHIKEEIADIMVMLRQFQYYYDITDEQINKVMEHKIDRQLQRIENDN